MRKTMVMLLFMTALGPLFPALTDAAEELFDTKTANEHIEKGIALLKAKDYDGAIREFEESASIYPDAEPFYYLGYTYYLKGKSGDSESRKKSLENFDKAYELNPNFTPTRYRPPEAEAATAKPGREKKGAEAAKSPEETQKQPPETPGQPQEPAVQEQPQPSQQSGEEKKGSSPN